MDDRELEATLRRVMAPTREHADAAAERLVARLTTAKLPAQKRRLLAGWWPSALLNSDFAPAWPRVTTLACGAALGIVIGLSSLGMRIATDLDLWRVASADDVRVTIFDADSVAGLRP